jgi:hypothetical protein
MGDLATGLDRLAGLLHAHLSHAPDLAGDRFPRVGMVGL